MTKRFVLAWVFGAAMAVIATAPRAGNAPRERASWGEAARVEHSVLRTDRHPHAEIAGGAQPLSAFVDLSLEWRHAWRNDRNHNALWMFVKLSGTDAAGERAVRHARIAGMPEVSRSGSREGDERFVVRMTVDRAGFFLEPAGEFRGPGRASIRVPVDAAALEGLALESIRAQAHAIAMVYIPAGPFEAGAASAAELEYGAFYRSDAAGGYAGAFRIATEAEIPVGASDGALNYRRLQSLSYMGDARGPVPKAFPKGTRAFYVMEYELTQGQYAGFLNSIAGYGPDTRAIHAGPTYYDDRGTIRLEGGRYVAEDPDRPANFVGWEDGIAFLDWAGLRPMTELEYEKAARGPRGARPGEYVWGTDDTRALQRAVLPDGSLGMLDGSSPAELDDASAVRFGASYYWVMDLSGSLWERCVTVGDAAGRAFTGAHGDGNVNPYGDADVQGWPRELGSPRREKGFGYRGGGFYRANAEYDRYRPHSPVAFRPFGSWSGGPRHHAYGIRGVRTSD